MHLSSIELALRRSRAAQAVALLSASFALTSLLTYEAQDAAREHKALAYQTVRAAAQDVAGRLADAAGAELRVALATAFAPALGGRDLSLADFAAHVELATGVAAGYYVRMPADTAARGDRLTMEAVGAASPAARRWLADSLRALAGRAAPGGARRPVLFVVPEGRAVRVVAAAAVPERVGRPRVYAFELDGRHLREEILARAYRATPLVRGGGDQAAPADSLFSARLTARHGAVGTEVFRSGPQYDGPFAGEAVLPAALGAGVPLVAQVTLRPDVAERMLAGGLPTCRLPLLLSVLAANALLLAAAVGHLRREQIIAQRRSDFVSGVSHELRTPLAQIRVFAETMLLERMERPADRRRALEIIARETGRLTALIENVLHFARAERRLTTVRLEPAALAPLVHDVVDGFRPLARARGAALRVDADEALVALVDRDAVRQIVLNLLDNAAKYGPAGQAVVVRATAVRGRAQIIVEDEGPGIAPAERRRVWEPFYRLERDRRSAVGGSGIGLAVVRQLAQAHGGRTSAEAAPGGGARFVVDLGAALGGRVRAGALSPPAGAAFGAGVVAERVAAGVDA